jgi:hypothetical protein
MNNIIKLLLDQASEFKKVASGGSDKEVID